MKELQVEMEAVPRTQAKFVVRRILVPTDFTASSDHAFACALDIARSFEAHVSLMYVMGPLAGDRFSPLRLSPEASVTGQSPDDVVYSLLQSMVSDHDTEGIFVDAIKRRGLTVVPTLLRYAEEQHVDLIVVGLGKRRGTSTLFSNNLAEDIIRDAPCPVLSVKPPSSESGS